MLRDFTRYDRMAFVTYHKHLLLLENIIPMHIRPQILTPKMILLFNTFDIFKKQYIAL